MRSTCFLASGLLVVATLGLATVGRAQAPARAAAAVPDAFQAKAIVALSDADMVPSAYVDDKLGPPAGTDVLSVVRFDGRRVAPVSMQTLPISNSVTGPPAAVATTPDGRYAITIETRGPRTSSSAGGTLTGLPNGRLISVVDLADLRHPRVVQQVLGPRRAVGVSVSADGTLVALAVHPAGDGTAAPLWLYRFGRGRLSGGAAVPIPDWTAGDELVTAVFHPSRPLLALTNKTKNQLLLASVQAVGAGWQLARWGNAVAIESGNLLTCFSPDGRFVFANGGPASPAPNERQHGWVLSVRLDAHPGTAAEPTHELVSRAPTGYIPEGLAVSPDGRLLVTTNLEQTFQPVGSAQRGRYASLTLLAIDPASGALTSAGDFAFDGMLPESAVFDASSRRLAVANFGHLDDLLASGSLDFWRVVGAPTGPEPLRLVKTAYALPLQRGVHTLSVVR
ncbi:hypothetical protein HHL22_11780 [Hymenobacter sp. RP-2-7]|uniref:WD40 repeat domain-containing protein n=1 Tax=Hymenobacter polaris TaxID=2682546 RepID=A0A7Y0AF14_9BACT|nr:hypothetical protein [Hymenobacter polaris]NML65885.1 hypothetical protein [Hymenobacter polaris]